MCQDVCYRKRKGNNIAITIKHTSFRSIYVLFMTSISRTEAKSVLYDKNINTLFLTIMLYEEVIVHGVI